MRPRRPSMSPPRVERRVPALFFFDGWLPLLRTALLGISAYLALVLLLRLSGKRTLSKMNAFDVLVTTTLGSTLASVLLSKSTTLAQGVVGFALLVGCQFVVTWASVRWRWVRRLVSRDAQLLLYRGEFIAAAMKGCRVTKAAVLAALRAAGRSSDRLHRRFTPTVRCRKDVSMVDADYVGGRTI